MSVFVSWSGARSKAIAQGLRTWLPNVLQATNVWMSDVDIEAGSRGINEIFGNLEKAKIGIICLTPENRTAPWLLFEAGAISKQVSDRTKVCPYLFGLRSVEVPGPLAEFQAVTADEEGTRRLLKAVNNSLDQAKLADEKLDKAFTVWWVEMKATLDAINEPTDVVASTPSLEEQLSEIVGSAREILRRFDEERDFYMSADAVRRELAAMKEARQDVVASSREHLKEVMADPSFLTESLSKVFKTPEAIAMMLDALAEVPQIKTFFGEVEDPDKMSQLRSVLNLAAKAGDAKGRRHLGHGSKKTETGKHTDSAVELTSNEN